jgi:uncharacterized protein YgbK (DUF1537 family)
MRWVSYYGDDFTGSTDVMEALASHGVETVLFTRIPTESEFRPFAGHAAVGLAGTSRSQTPAWMDENLPVAFGWLKSLGARFCHYKVCSTFDSAPQVGSIGRAAEIGAAVFGQSRLPLIIGAPQLGRFTFGANLFATYQGTVFRIDRHPVMSRHPVTPMKEADLRLHLAAQTALPVTLDGAETAEGGIVLHDVHDQASQALAGRRLLHLAGGFVIGSSGVEYALLRALTEAGEITGTARFSPLDPVSQTLVVSGSVSPTTERQIRHALQHGFAAVPVEAEALAADRPGTRQAAIASALSVLASGKSPLIHTALGPGSDKGDRLDAIDGGRRRIGESLGAIFKAVLDQGGLRRAIIAGGDSSSHALGQLDIYALTTRMPLASTPGSPLCCATSGNPVFDGLELALKGGQIGRDDYFTALRDGRL